MKKINLSRSIVNLRATLRKDENFTGSFGMAGPPALGVPKKKGKIRKKKIKLGEAGESFSSRGRKHGAVPPESRRGQLGRSLRSSRSAQQQTPDPRLVVPSTAAGRMKKLTSHPSHKQATATLQRDVNPAKPVGRFRRVVQRIGKVFKR